MIFQELKQFEQKKDEKEFEIFSRYIIDFLNLYYKDVKQSNKPLILNFNDMIKFFPLEFNIIENWENDYDQTLTLFMNLVLSWSGKKRKIFFEVPDKLFIEEGFFNLTSDYSNKVIKIKATVDLINQYEDIPLSYKVICNSCGEEMIERKFVFKKCSKCQSQQLIKRPNEFISRRHIDLSDPNQTEGSCVIEGYIDIFSKTDRVIFPENLIGQDLELIGLMRLEKLNFGNFKRKFEIIGLKLDKYKGLKPEKIKKIVKKVREDENAFVNLALSMNKDIKGMDYLKFVLFAVAVGLAYPDKQFGNTHVGLNVMVIGSPAIAKSNIMENLTRFFYKSRKSTAKSLSKAGIGGGVDITKEKRTISAGEIVRCNNGVLFIDECKHLADEVKAILLTCMSDGWHTLKYAGINFKFKYNTNIVLIGNPKFGELAPDTPLKDQVDFDPEFMSRCFIVITPTAYFVENDGSVNIERLDQVFEIRRINEKDNINKKEQKYDDKFLLDYATTVKTFPNSILEREEELLIEDYIRSFAENQNLNGTFHNSADHNRGKLDLRMINSLKIFAKVIARAEFSEKVMPRHIKLVIDIYENTMIKFRQLYKMETLDVIETQMIETNKKVYPKSKEEKKAFVLSKIPNHETIDWADLLELSINHGISETELEKILKENHHEYYEPKPNKLMKT